MRFKDREKQYNERYFIQNRTRDWNENQWVFQRTISGRCFLDDYRFVGTKKRYYAEVDSVMLFQYGEDTAYGYVPGDTEPYELEYFSIDSGFMDDILEELRERLGPVFMIERASGVDQMWREIFSHANSEKRIGEYRTSAQIYSLVMELFNGSSHSCESPAEKLMESIEKYYREPVTIQELSNSLELSREHLAREFIRKYNISPSLYLENKRLELACELLQKSNAKVRAIAMYCGFSSSHSFSRFFVRKKGCTPLVYRMQTG